MFFPKKVLMEKEALNYPVGERVYKFSRQHNIPVEVLPKTVRFTSMEEKPLKKFLEAKETLAVVVKKKIQFLTCKPSADYQLPLITSCPGLCTYCYLFTNLGKTPYLRVYANTGEIFQKAKEIINKNARLTAFEGSATSDPVAVEPITGSLKEAISFFAQIELGRFRFTTKFTDIDSLIDLDHRFRTEIRFSINTPYIIKKYEFRTPCLEARLEASKKIKKAGYPLGFLIAPVFVYDGWERDYRKLLEQLAGAMDGLYFTLEIISHRFTARAKSNIEVLFPRHGLPLGEENRRYQFGQFGYGKYVYDKDNFNKLKEFFYQEVPKILPQVKILYIV
ncbi:spore photoproduct lyase [Carboxydothermus islandicus]|uniref:Spore photoproduct lyase n=1 Tax=Carboxydothermus islandicus TaxID=661089 RepID=A0A1L8D2C0_9THEO|nr:spore photoproduct lyase [Carboxydothermus islandicus]GAV25241.1 spore photoproduct lyase [Carboxydothermus islandicus]